MKVRLALFTFLTMILFFGLLVYLYDVNFVYLAKMTWIRNPGMITKHLLRVSGVNGYFLWSNGPDKLKSRPGKWVSVKEAPYNAAGDGGANDSLAIQSAIDAVEAAGGGVIFFPEGTYKCKNVKLKSNITCLFADNAVMKALEGEYMGKYDVVLILSGVSNVIISGGVIDGNREFMSGEGEWRHGISVMGSKNVIIHDTVAQNTGGDGICVGTSISENKDILLNQVTCDNNKRQGLTIGHVDGLYCLNSEFKNTRGTLPEAGIDIEPDKSSNVCRNITISNCLMHDNKGNGVEIFLKNDAIQGYISINGCNIYGNHSNGIQTRNINHLIIDSCNIYNNLAQGIYVVNNTKNVQITYNKIHENITRGIFVRPQRDATETLKNITIAFNIIKNTGGPSSYGIQITDESDAQKINYLTLYKNIIYDDQKPPTQKYPFAVRGCKYVFIAGNGCHRNINKIEDYLLTPTDAVILDGPWLRITTSASLINENMYIIFTHKQKKVSSGYLRDMVNSVREKAAVFLFHRNHDKNLSS